MCNDHSTTLRRSTSIALISSEFGGISSVPTNGRNTAAKTLFFLLFGFAISSLVASAAPISVVLNSQYQLPASRTTGKAAKQYHTRDATIKVTQGTTKANGTGSPFKFDLPADAETTVEVSSEVPLLKVAPPKDGKLGDAYSMKSVVKTLPAVADGVSTLNIDVGSTDAANADVKKQATAFAVMDAMGTGNRFIKQLGEKQTRTTQVIFPYAGDGTANFYRKSDRTIRVRDNQRALDWDVMLHEYGHFVQHEYGFYPPGGGHHFFGRESNTSLAFNEGFATFFSLWAQQEEKTVPTGIINVGDTNYTNTQGKWEVQIEGNNWTSPDGKTQKLNSLGAKDELSVARYLWDVFDDTPKEPLNDNGDGKKNDEISLGSAKVWNTLKATGAGGYTRMISKITEDVVNSQIGNVAAQIAGLRNLGNLNEDHGFGATVGGVKKAAPKRDGVEPTLSAVATDALDETLVFEWHTVFGSNDLPSDIDFEDDHSEEDPALGLDDPNFSAFKLAFFDDVFQNSIFETDWIEAGTGNLNYFLEDDRTTWDYSLSLSDFGSLQAGLDALGTDRFGWTVLTDSMLGERSPDIFSGGIWGTQMLSSLAVPEPTSVIMALAGVLVTLLHSRSSR